jgi:glutamate N-acetyltransferase/amino-acid N-acetyltransferase
MTELSTQLLPLGFRYGATTAGLKASGRPDVAFIVADVPASAAAMFTANQVVAAPLVIDKQHLTATGGKVRAVVVNAGNANCANGEAGLQAARDVCEAAAKLVGCPANEVFPASTGIIGVLLPAEKIVAALPTIQLGRHPDHFSALAQAILTTDTIEKTALARFEQDGKIVHIAAVCKGSGMIHPRLVPHATMLVYILTDAAITPEVLNGYLQGAVNKSFNRISVDGDTSTNDTVLLLASGASGATIEAGNTEFALALEQVSISLAKQIVGDGEGISHVIELQIEGAGSDEDALSVAKSIAHSPLVKTAWAGCDPNWGRLMAAIGNSSAQVRPEAIAIFFGDLEMCRNGGRSPLLDMAKAHEYLKQDEYSIRIDLNVGSGSCRFWTTDLTVEYIHINADYST